MLGRIILGLAICFVGGVVAYYSGQLAQIMGRMEWADRYLGGTRQGILFFGVLIFIIGGLIMLGVLGFADPTAVRTNGFG